MRKYINRVLCKFGYVTQEKFRAQERQIASLKTEIDELNKLNMSEIIQVIQRARMVTIQYETPTFVITSDDFCSPVEEARINTRPPVESNWYALTTKIDVGLLQRVNNDLLYTGKSSELDYFLAMITRKLIDQAKVAMRLQRPSN